ncbi:MAG: protein-disulfide reductase DsbD [Burkholderiales bacterium]|nr:protein-disulfide reductase DsbD [Burkholderiales bacterium]
MRAAWALLAVLLTFVISGPARAAGDFLDPDQAFTLSVRVLDAKKLELDYKVAPGYYLYRERFKFSSPDARLGEPQIPPGKKHYDTALEQNVETYHDGVVVILPVASAGKSFTLYATHQGCADKGLCYPPQPRTLAVTMKAFGADADSVKVVADADAAAPAGVNPPAVGQVAGGMSVAPGALSDPLRSVTMAPGVAPQVDRAPPGATPTILAPAPARAAAASAASPTSTGARPSSVDDRFLANLQRGGLLVMLPLAFLVGLLLSLTPCVLPMLPILSAIIVGQGGEVTRNRGLLLAATYSLGMALVYTLLGIAAALAGEGLAAYLQNPVVLVSFGVLLLILSLSMFGVYELQLPAFLRDRLSSVNSSLTGGQLGGVFMMGVLSALIVSPCVSGPLAGVLLFIARTHDVVLGGSALFAIATGMSVPLLLAGASAGALLPRAGAWMERVKQLFGLMLVGVAFWIMGPVLPQGVHAVVFGALLILSATTIGAFDSLTAAAGAAARLAKGLGLVLAVIGALVLYRQVVGGGTSGGAVVAAQAGPHFERVSSVAELDQRLRTAGRPVMLDFYADWCVSCKEMESQTFVDPAVRARLDKAVLLRADVTANSPEDRALLKRFDLFGPPGIILFDAQGREVASARVVGFQDASDFAASLAAAGL